MSSSINQERPASTATTEAAAKPVAVIDIGTAAIRMVIAEIDGRGNVRKLESLSQDVNLGRDTFTKGAIGKATIEQCVRVLTSYRQLLKEYQITSPEQMRVVATSAVREAQNRMAFLDRIYIATGIQVEPTDEAEVSRITYLGIQPHLRSEPSLAGATALVIEVGGGSTEVLVVRDGDVVLSHNYRVGALRLRETLEAHRAPAAQLRKIMESQIQRTVDLIAQQVVGHENLVMIALGGDVRFAATQLAPDRDPTRLCGVGIRALERFADAVLHKTVDELVHEYHLTFPDAETLGPALLAYVHLARALKLETIYVSGVNFRDGLLMELAASGRSSEVSAKPVIQSALELGRKYHFDERHARHVAELAKMLFHQLQPHHQLDARYELILYVAALLHEIGIFVSTVSHHKHSLYLISHSELFGLRAEDMVLVGLVARYHRRASPKPTHYQYASLDRDQRIAVAKLAAILRVADALDRSRSQRIHELQCERDDDRLVISVPHVEDLSLEQLAMKEKGTLFEEIFGVPILLRKTGP